MSKPIIRRATRADIEAFSPMRNKPTIKALCMELDGRVVGLAGCAIVNGRWFGFCDLTQEARPYKMAIARAAKRFLADMKTQSVRFVYAQADPAEPGAVRWLTSLGFSIEARSGHLYRWGD